jgi:predicted RecA/RadA family phage recombinase
MQNQFQVRGDHIDVVLPYARNSGDGALIGSMFGVCANGGANAADDVLVVRGVFTLTKRSLEAWTVGDLVYWDNTSKYLTSTASGNTLIGVAVVAAANPSSTGVVRLNGSFS